MKTSPWNNELPPPLESKGGVFAVQDIFDGCIHTGVSPWPPPELLQKAYRSRQEYAFGDIIHNFGYYCDLQSIHSEDAITWSVFGTLAKEPVATRVAWTRQFAALCDIDTSCWMSPEICLWRRVPHPESHVVGGPEIDFLVIDEKAIIIGEAKWRSEIGKAQGVSKDKDQLELRRLLAKNFFSKATPSATVYIVEVGLDESSRSRIGEIGGRYITWERICTLSTHPLRDELGRYYAWKRRWTKK